MSMIVKRAWRLLGGVVIIVIIGLMIVQPWPTTAVSSYGAHPQRPFVPANRPVDRAQVSEPVTPVSSLPVRDLPTGDIPPLLDREVNPIRSPFWLSGPIEIAEHGPDALVATSLYRGGDGTPPVDLTFAGMSSNTTGGAQVPDTNGDVGPNHYVQMVNFAFTIFDKSGNTLTGPTSLNQLWVPLGSPCGTQNTGDPVVVYDSLADRWLLTQFAFSAEMCLAVSQTPDPTGAYHLYHFTMPTFPDYFKLGVWPDGYYLSANEYQIGDFSAMAFDRVRMLNGDAATYQRFGGGDNMYLPSDVDGPTPPPTDSPNYFYTFLDDSFHGGSDRLEVWAFDVDWDIPANSTFTLARAIPITAYNYTVCGFFVLNCIPQPAPGALLSPVSEFPMWRFSYRNFGSHETLLGNFAIDVNGANQSGIRWFELRKTGSGEWALHQEGTLAPDSHNRWMGSMAMDQDGNIGMGFSVASNTLNPAIRYTVRGADDPLGTLRMEESMVEGNGVQTGTSRWGDYAAMSIDPTDDCTFWFTTEYYPVTAGTNWGTQINTFRMPSCGSDPTDMGISKTAASDLLLGDALTYTLVISNNGPVTATAVTVVDTLPSQIQFTSATPPEADCQHDSAVVTCNLGMMLAQTSMTITLVTMPSQAGTFTNTVTVSANGVDIDESNNTAVATTTVVEAMADLDIALAATTPTVYANDLITYSLIITNNGPQTSTGIVITDTLPAGTTLSTASQGCGMSNGRLLCTISSLAAGNSDDLTIVLEAPAMVGEFTNFVTVRGNEVDPNKNNNSDDAVVAVQHHLTWIPFFVR